MQFDIAATNMGPNSIFQQDNFGRIVRAAFEENNISLLPWPTNIPDFNTIEKERKRMVLAG